MTEATLCLSCSSVSPPLHPSIKLTGEPLLHCSHGATSTGSLSPLTFKSGCSTSGSFMAGPCTPQKFTSRNSKVSSYEMLRVSCEVHLCSFGDRLVDTTFSLFHETCVCVCMCALPNCKTLQKSGPNSHREQHMSTIHGCFHEPLLCNYFIDYDWHY